MKNHIVKKFFEPIEAVRFEGEIADYSKLGYVTQMLNSMRDILPHNSYIIDYHKQNFYFISKDSIFLCGYKEEEVMEWGYQFYQKIISEEDLVKLLEINEAGFDFFYKIEPERQPETSISYDLVFHKKDGSTMCVNHKLKPFLFGPDGKIWMAICCVRPSANDKMGNVKCFFRDTNERFSYSFKEKKWHQLPSFTLTDTEHFIVLETDKGTVEKQLADKLNCTRSNIRYYKSQILKKTDTQTMREAILFLTSNGIV